MKKFIIIFCIPAISIFIIFLSVSYINRITLNSDIVNIKINSLENLNGKTKNEILTKRQKYISKNVRTKFYDKPRSGMNKILIQNEQARNEPCELVCEMKCS